MTARILSDFVGFQVISSSEQLDNGAIVLHTAQSSEAQFISGLNSPLWQTIGFASRPALASKAGAAEAVVIPYGNEDQVIASRDLRCALPSGLEPGETALYAGGPNNTGTGEIRLSDDGEAEIIIRTRKGNSSGGSAVSITVGSDAVITIDAGQRGRIRITETAIELGDNAAFSATMAEPLESFLSSLLVSLTAGTAGGNPFVFAPPLPSVPTLGSAVVKLNQ